MSRSDVLGVVAGEVCRLPAGRVVRVAVDGIDGAGKTCFADELAQRLVGCGRVPIRASVDGFHHPAAVRYQRGRRSPDGFYRDSYDYALLAEVLLNPLGPAGDRRYLPRIHDVTTDQPVPPRPETAEPDSILVFDGIFLHRPELIGYWDYSVFLDVPFAVSAARMAGRDHTDPDPAAPANHRYVAGQQIYLTECRPQEQATIVIDNTDLSARSIRQRRPAPGPI
jgi:uridine kinase